MTVHPDWTQETRQGKLVYCMTFPDDCTLVIDGGVLHIAATDYKCDDDVARTFLALSREGVRKEVCRRLRGAHLL